MGKKGSRRSFGNNGAMIRRVFPARGAEKAGAISNSAVALAKGGNTRAAVRVIIRAIRVSPQHGGYWYNLGMFLHLSRRHRWASHFLGHACTLSPDQAGPLFTLGTVRLELGEPSLAKQCFEQALALDPDHASTLVSLCRAEFQLHGKAIASDLIQTVFERVKANPDAASDLAVFAFEIGGRELSDRLFESTLAMYPSHCPTLTNYIPVLLDLDRLEDADKISQKALSLAPESPEALCNRALTLSRIGQIEESVTLLQRASVLAPRNPAIWSNLGTAHQAQGRHAEAIAHFHEALVIDPGHSDAKFNLGLIYLQQGRFSAGWSLYDTRWTASSSSSTYLDTKLPKWQPTSPFRHPLVWCEQGIGDQIQFLSLVNLLSSAVDTVSLVVDHRLATLVKRSFPQVEVIPNRGAWDLSHCDSEVPLGDLAGIFLPTTQALKAIAINYLNPDATLSNLIRTRVSENFPTATKLIGISWFSKAPKTGRHRSTSLVTLLGLIGDKTNAYVVLQYDYSIEEIEAAVIDGWQIYVDSGVDVRNDFEWLASAIASCDLVLTIDNVTAHIAGAIGKPTALLLNKNRDWRWGTADEPISWYPSVNIITA